VQGYKAISYQFTPVFYEPRTLENH